MTDQTLIDLPSDERRLLMEYRRVFCDRYHHIARERDVAEEQCNELLSVIEPILTLWGKDEYNGPVAPINDAILVVARVKAQRSR